MFNKIKDYFKKFSIFGAGMLIGVVYGSIVSTLTCVAVLGLP